MKISTAPDNTGFAPPDSRWTAVDDGTYDGADESNHPVGRGATEAEAIADLMEQIDERVWCPMSEAPETPGTYISVRSVTTYRWLAYKPEGARQTGKPGRWQRATEHGWENCPKPDGEWAPVT